MVRKALKVTERLNVERLSGTLFGVKAFWGAVLQASWFLGGNPSPLNAVC